MSTVRIQVRRGLASEWTTANPVLAAGEMGVETNTNLFKFGNGSSTWTALSYANNSDVAIGEISQDAINTALSMGAGLTKTYNDGANTITITVDTDVVSTKAFATSEATSKATAARVAAEAYTDSAVSGVNNSLSGYIETGDRGTANGVASLDGNVKVPEAQLKLDNLSSNITTSGNVEAGNVTVSGNLIVNGTTVTMNTANVSMEDTLLYLADGNNTNQLDLGFVAAHNDGTYNHTGLVRDESAGKWKLFTGVTDEPTTTINFAQGTLDDLAVRGLTATDINLTNLTVTGTASLPANSISQAQMSDDSVGTNEISGGAVTTAKIASSAVVADKLATDSVTEAKISNNAVTTAKIADNAVTTAKIAADAVTNGKIAADAVTELKILNNAVTADKVANNAVTELKIANNAVTANKLAADSVAEAKIAADAVTTAKIAFGAVTADKIAADAVTTDKIAADAVTETKILNNSVTSAKIASQTIVDGDISPTAAIAKSKIDGLTSDLATLSTKESPTFTGTVTLPGTTSIGTVSSTEIAYLDGVTSSVQSQITAAGTALANHESDTTNVHGIADTSVLATATTVAAAKSEAIAAAAADATTKADAAKTAAEATAAAALSGAISTEVSGRNSAIATAKSEAIADATAQVNAVIAAAPAALNTLDELAAALGDDANFAGTITSSVALKAPIASPTFTGTVTVAAAGVAFTDGTQTKAGVPSITNIPAALAAGAQTIAGGRADQFVPLTGAVVITLPSTGYSTGQSIDFFQESGTGASFASTNSVVGTPGLKFRATHSVATALKTSSGWLVFGDLSA
jgi:hypothetical protein